MNSAEVPSPELLARVSHLTGRAPRAWSRVGGGYTHAGRWRVELEGGASVFVKAATDADTGDWLRAEWRIYGAISARYLARVIAWEDGELPVLILEDLSGGRWPPPWTDAMVARVLETCAQIAATPPPPGTPRMARDRESFLSWRKVERDPGPFLRLGLCDAAWLKRHIGALMDAESRADFEGESLAHFDLRSDNLCLLPDRAVAVDWNWACIGNPRLDVGSWLSSLVMEGGPPPEAILPDAPEIAALFSGFFAWRAGQPLIPHAPRVREVQLFQLQGALPWVVRALRLPPPGL